MKSLIKNIAIHTVGVYAVPMVFNGMTVSGGLTNYIVAAAVLTVLFYIVKPILSIVTLPINALTFGAFSFVINALMFYLLTIMVPFVSISDFTFNGLNVAGFIIPSLYFNTFFAYIVISLAFSVIVTLLRWILDK